MFEGNFADTTDDFFVLMLTNRLCPACTDMGSEEILNRWKMTSDEDNLHVPKKFDLKTESKFNMSMIDCLVLYPSHI